MVHQPGLGIQGSDTAGAGGSNGLLVVVVDEVAAGKDSVDVGAGTAAVHLHVALGINLNLAPD